MKKYYVKWQLNHIPDGITREEVSEEYGASQSAVLLSCAEMEDGSYSQMHFSIDGKTGLELTPNYLFKTWLMFGMQIAKIPGLSAKRRAICQSAAKVFMEDE